MTEILSSINVIRSYPLATIENDQIKLIRVERQFDIGDISNALPGNRVRGYVDAP